MPLPHDPGPHWGEVGIHGIARPREWDAVATVSELLLEGDEVTFVALPDGRLIVESGMPGIDAQPFARALERELSPPFRAEAVRREERLWAVAGRAIETITLADDPGGSLLELTWDGRELMTRIDGATEPFATKELEAVGSSRYRTYAVRALRLRHDVWELSVAPL